MPGFSNNFENYLLQYVFKQTAVPISAPTTLFVSLHTTDPTDTVGTANSNELTSSSPSYARAQLNPDPNTSTNTNWSASTLVGGGNLGHVISNVTAVQFAAATGAWFAGAPIPNFGLYSIGPIGTGTADQYLISGLITGNGVIVNSGNTLKFLAGNLTFTLT